MRIKIVIAGEGGQGIQTIAEVLAASAAESGFEVAYIPSFGVEQRGTPSVAFVTISSEKVHCPIFSEADFAVILQPRAVKSVSKNITPNTRIIFDSSTTSPTDLGKKSLKHFGIPATKLAQEREIPKSFNLIVLGSIVKELKLDSNAVWKNIVKALGAKFKTEKIISDNQNAFHLGLDAVFEQKEFSQPIFKPRHSEVLYKGYSKKGRVLPLLCKGCGLCIAKCPVGALSFSAELGVYGNRIPTCDLEKCIACGNCKLFCPDGAIVMEKDALAIPTKANVPNIDNA